MPPNPPGSEAEMAGDQVTLREHELLGPGDLAG
jgi:hypothetical protein